MAKGFSVNIKEMIKEKILEGRKNFTSKMSVNSIDFPSLGFSILCLKIEAKIMKLCCVTINVCRRNINSNFITNGGEKETEKVIRFLYFTQTGQ